VDCLCLLLSDVGSGWEVYLLVLGGRGGGEVGCSVWCVGRGGGCLL